MKIQVESYTADVDAIFPDEYPFLGMGVEINELWDQAGNPVEYDEALWSRLAKILLDTLDEEEPDTPLEIELPPSNLYPF